ncbi:MAG TPA: hypothetical protein VKP69_21860 [Isosphaeraceae bacterium]|nr:hypothetical protein [Isosphaeraceae bacterium]
MAPPRTLLLAPSWFSAARLGDGPALRVAEPPNRSGTWTWKDPQGATHRHEMEVEGVGAKFSARERSNALPPVRIRDPKLDGNKRRFHRCPRPEARRLPRRRGQPGTFNGKVSVTLEGQTTDCVWGANRSSLRRTVSMPESTSASETRRRPRQSGHLPRTIL